jgi:hypothetical protein
MRNRRTHRAVNERKGGLLPMVVKAVSRLCMISSSPAFVSLENEFAHRVSVNEFEAVAKSVSLPSRSKKSSQVQTEA